MLFSHSARHARVQLVRWVSLGEKGKQRQSRSLLLCSCVRSRRAALADSLRVGGQRNAHNTSVTAGGGSLGRDRHCHRGNSWAAAVFDDDTQPRATRVPRHRQLELETASKHAY